jgi:hypothetical protein
VSAWLAAALLAWSAFVAGFVLGAWWAGGRGAP